MSTQVCKIRGYGYKFNYKDNIFSFIKDADIEYDYLNIIGKNFSYYDFRDWQSQDKKNIEPLLAVVIDGMNGEYKYVIYVENAHYIENTLGDAYWDINPRFDDWVEDNAQEKIEIFLQRKLDRKPQMFDFEHWC
jgi:hypothetical protein